ncbi:MAG: hypothetical protein Ct9H300mP16_01170 [Pseudomonadota bacterium]|nr:MAG: hypothetical protein Ct9H300mP16_01170 [Pseudomonadota bacterium]
MVVVNNSGELDRSRSVGKVEALDGSWPAVSSAGARGPFPYPLGDPRRRDRANAHPHICRDALALVCNGIVENHATLRQAQEAAGLPFTSETDTEVVVHQVYIHLEAGMDLAAAVRTTMGELEGNYSLGVVQAGAPGRLVAARNGPPLLVGIGEDSFFIASDIAALVPVTRRYRCWKMATSPISAMASAPSAYRHGNPVERPERESHQSSDAATLGDYDHFMQKEIHEQPRAIADTLEGRLAGDRVLEQAFGPAAGRSSTGPGRCRSSPVAPVITPDWWPSTGWNTSASPVRSRLRANTATVVTSPEAVQWWSRSRSPGKTADTLAALAEAQNLGIVGSLVICNVPNRHWSESPTSPS